MLPEIEVTRDAIELNNMQDDWDKMNNYLKLKKIRKSLKTVEQSNIVRKKRLYQGIVIISGQEFFIDIFQTKTKF
jgi:hypothetical protein